MAVIVALALAIFVLPSPWGIVAVFAGIAIEIVEQVFWFRYQRRQKVRTGVEAHVGESAEVISACAPEGRVRFRGEIWRARAERPLAAGEAATISAVEGLTLVVEPERQAAETD